MGKRETRVQVIVLAEMSSCDYFGLDPARVVVSLGAPPPVETGILTRHVAHSRRIHSPFYYDYSLERLILAEGKIEEAAMAVVVSTAAVSGRKAEKHLVAEAGVETDVDRNEMNKVAETSTSKTVATMVEMGLENSGGVVCVEEAEDDPCFSLSPVVARARKSSATFARQTSRGFLSLLGRPSLTSPGNSPSSSLSSARKRARGVLGNELPMSNVKSPFDSPKRSKSGRQSSPKKEPDLTTISTAAAPDIAPSKRESRPAINPLPGPNPAMSPTVPLSLAHQPPSFKSSLLSVQNEIAGGAIVKKLMQRLGELEELVENLQRNGNKSNIGTISARSVMVVDEDANTSSRRSSTSRSLPLHMAEPS